jgi:diguanylate cyclase (GGDEF)-like protein
MPALLRTPLRGPDMEKPFALIVEDDRDIAALFRHVLDIAGYHTEIVLHGGEAVNRLKSAQPDIVLLDLSLPGVSGEKILEGMRADTRLKSVPVVVVTAHSRVADNLAVEPDLVLLKPVNLSQLSNLVQRLKNTPVAMPDAPWDVPTHLYNQRFFSVRLTYSLERAKQIGENRFGVMFVDLDPFASIEQRVAPEQLNDFLREVAGHLKTRLRPTDTLSRFDAGLFLALLENIPNDSTPARIAARIQRELGDLILQKEFLDGLHAYVGVVTCGASYDSIEEILGDVNIARKLARSEQARTQYDRDLLRGFRGAVYNP